jgi:hypothetical protein
MAHRVVGVGAHTGTHPPWDISSKGRRIHDKTYGLRGRHMQGHFVTASMIYVVVKRGAHCNENLICVFPEKEFRGLSCSKIVIVIALIVMHGKVPNSNARCVGGSSTLSEGGGGRVTSSNLKVFNFILKVRKLKRKPN